MDKQEIVNKNTDHFIKSCSNWLIVDTFKRSMTLQALCNLIQDDKARKIAIDNCIEQQHNLMLQCRDYITYTQ